MYSTIDLGESNYNLFRFEEFYPEELRRLDPFYRPGYNVTVVKLKAEFRDLRCAFMKSYANFQKAGQGEAENSQSVDSYEEDNNEKEDEKRFIGTPKR